MRNLLALAASLCLLLVSGCFGKKSSPAQADTYQPFSLSGTNASGSGEKLIVTPAEGLKGNVSAVNANLRFVVLTFPIGHMAEASQRLNVYRKGLKVGEINVTGPQRDDSIVADIVAGDAKVGDEVRDR